jgi:hypothetical protein
MMMFIRTLMFGALTTLMGATAAHAQVTEAMQFKTTFPFTVGNTKYPAGSFTIKPADDGDNTVLELTNGKITTVVLVEPEAPNPNQAVKDEVVFNKYGDEYVLNEIWDSADGTGARAERSLAETRHAKKHGAPTKESVSSSRGLASGS